MEGVGMIFEKVLKPSDLVTLIAFDNNIHVIVPFIDEGKSKYQYYYRRPSRLRKPRKQEKQKNKTILVEVSLYMQRISTFSKGTKG